ncbi:MAG: hypothetical protein AAGD10_15990 [Myxococcota bacterium]
MGVEAARVFFACTVCLGLGVLMGALGTRMIYGDPATISPAPRSEPRPCPACPAPSPCPGVDMVEGLPEGGPSFAGAPSSPGLPLSVLEAVERRMVETSSACQAREDAQVLMELTLTATSGMVRVEDALAVENSVRDEELSRCLDARARQIVLPWQGAGHARLAVPLQLESALPSWPELR